jgi:predicted dehydrogenase
LVAVGAGRVFERFHLPALRSVPHWTLLGVADSSAQRLASIASQLSGAGTAEALGPLLSQYRPDAVLITSPPESHAALATEALNAGAHVLVEKPMVPGPDQAEALLELARSRNRRIFVGFNRRFRPAYSALRHLLARSPERRTRQVRFDLCTDPASWGSFGSPSAGPDPSITLLQDLASHQLDLIPWLLGREPRRIQAGLVQRDGRGTRIRLQLEFSDDLRATCLAGHVPEFVERLEVGLERGEWLAGPGGLAPRRGLPRALVFGWLDGRSRARALARKLMGRPGDTLETFRRQYLAWAQVLSGTALEEAGVNQSVADGAAGARSVALIDAGCRSLALGGAWIDTTATPHS